MTTIDSTFELFYADATKAALDGIQTSGFPYITGTNLINRVKYVITCKTSPSSAVRAALSMIDELVRFNKSDIEFLTVPLLPFALERLGIDKDKNTIAAISATSAAIVTSVSESCLPIVLDALYDCLISKTRKWQTRVAALGLIGNLAHIHSAAMKLELPNVTPRVSECMGDVRKEVSDAAFNTLTSIFAIVGNNDIAAVIPTIVSAIAHPGEVADAIHALSSTTFVQAVDEATLAVLVPLLTRGIIERTVAIKRKAAVIISNMAKLVPESRFATPLIPKLLPGLKRLRDEVSDPDCRAVATKAFDTLLIAAGCATEEEAIAKAATMDAANSQRGKKNTVTNANKMQSKSNESFKKPIEDIVIDTVILDPGVIAIIDSLTDTLSLLNIDPVATLMSAIRITVPSCVDDTVAISMVNAALRHIAIAAARLVNEKNWTIASWSTISRPYITPFIVSTMTDAVVSDFINRVHYTVTGSHIGHSSTTNDISDPDAEDATIPNLCKCEFSLAYGGLILLNTAQLHMKRGRRYGLLGRNGCGKSTLMKAIANGQLEGFPPKTELRTAYVEAAVDAPEGVTVFDFVLSDPLVSEIVDVNGINGINVAKEQLYALGFTQAMLDGPIAGLSGGWRMKCALARAIIAKVDLFLLDEPTNHLDIANVKWLTQFLSSTDFDGSCLIVSHDAAFLDTVCTHIVHYDGNFKLKTYKGNLTAFVERCPEAKAYFDLAATTVTFTFPEPGFLDGVKSKDKAILKVNHASVTYPGCTSPSLIDASIALSLSSRVVVHGRNGAGKSTLIKVLTGELEPTEGSVWKLPGVRVAYVAQHAFHHLEEHLDKTPHEYLMWRYATGEDREGQAKASRVITDEEQKRMNEKVIVDGQKLVVETLIARRKLGREWEYEVKFVGLPTDKNQYMPRNWLEAIGWGKAVDSLDSREAAASGLMSKPLTSINVVKHFEQVGLESEFTLHNRMRGFSGGQKVKIVLGAALWQNPHLLVLDEPSNYIDVDSLGALSAALKSFGGGVILVTHHEAFTRELASETWDVADGRVVTTGMKWAATVLERGLEPDEIIDAAGNVIKIAPKLNAKDQRRKMKERMARRKKGEEVFSDEDD
jgi:elongation factor 3